MLIGVLGPRAYAGKKLPPFSTVTGSETSLATSRPRAVSASATMPPPTFTPLSAPIQGVAPRQPSSTKPSLDTPPLSKARFLRRNAAASATLPSDLPDISADVPAPIQGVAPRQPSSTEPSLDTPPLSKARFLRRNAVTSVTLPSDLPDVSADVRAVSLPHQMPEPEPDPVRLPFY